MPKNSLAYPSVEILESISVRSRPDQNNRRHSAGEAIFLGIRDNYIDHFLHLR